MATDFHWILVEKVYWGACATRMPPNSWASNPATDAMSGLEVELPA
jgi:hypothetical protein